MIFKHEELRNKTDGYYVIGKEVSAETNAVLDRQVLKELWTGYAFRCSEIEFKHTDECCFCIGSPQKIMCGEHAYSINVDKNGIFLAAKNERNLIYAYMTLLDLMRMSDSGEVQIDYCEIRENPLIERRMIHFCVFPDSQIWEIERFVRLCGALKYTHIIIEFWGMLKYDCLKELSWEHGLSKDEIRPIIKEANDMGMEVIPMFNHWGHASQSRVKHGKHVVLNHNPKLQYLFSDDGWRWNIKNEKTRKLLRNIRAELIELCGDGEYFHMGCDEAYGFGFTDEEMKEVCDFINETADELEKDNRKAIIWADMLLYNSPDYNKNNKYTAFAPNKKCADFMTEHLNKKIILADWQYDSAEPPIETAITLKNENFNTLLCPWDRGLEISKACAQTVKEYNLYGILHTTWHTLSGGSYYIVKIATEGWSNFREENILYLTKTAEVLRKVYFTDGDYEKSGWAEYEIED